MKIEMEVEVNVTDLNSVSRIGTSYKGCVDVSYFRLKKAFGKPQLNPYEDSKVKAQWSGNINGMVFTIYDYKSDSSCEKNRDWHIGGNNKMIVDLIVAYLKAIKQEGL